MSTKLNALVIDDSGIMRKMVMKTLTDAKLAEFEFIEAEDGQIALEKMKANKIDIAFVDWNMPNMTGVDFVSEVRKAEKMSCEDYPISLVMVTSEKTVAKIQTALDEAGADAFISKPFTVDDLRQRLKKVVDRAQLMRMRRDRAREETAQEPPAPTGGWFSRLLS